MTERNPNQTIAVPSTDEEFRRAIQALQVSTQSIERQARALDAQATYLSTLRASELAATKRRATHASYLTQRQAAEVQHVTFTNEQFLDNLRAELQVESEGVAKDLKSVHTVVASVLSADDRALDALNVLASASADSTSLNTSELAQRVTRLTSALQHFRIQAVKDRLDCTYLHLLADLSALVPKPEEVPDDPDVTSETVGEIENDLGSLYAEIDDVVHMTVRHEHTAPIEATLREIDTARELEGKRAGDRIHNQLASLTDSLEELSVKLETLQVQRTGLRNLQAKTELLDRQHHPKPPPRNQAKVIPGASSSSSSTSTDTTMTKRPALSALLQHLSLSSPLPPPNINTQQDDSSLQHTALQTQTTTLQAQSDAHIAAILTAAEKAATARRNVLSAVTDRLDSEISLENKRRVGELERAVDDARVSMELGIQRERRA